ncbi:MAG: hypothetical protein IJZ29_02485 [Clostridia bacterium]|nr:hypothetical protein [Clostridia bacterium]
MKEFKARKWESIKRANKNVNSINVEVSLNVRKSIIFSNKKILVKKGELVLNDFTNLNDLRITNQYNLVKLDLSKVESLESLEICNNKNLGQIVLPENLENLKSIAIFGNNKNVDLSYEDFSKLIQGSVNGENKIERIKINQTLYYDIMENLKEDLQDYKFRYIFEDVVRWCDVVSGYGYTEKTTAQMQDYDNKITAFLSGLDLSNCKNEIGKLVVIYEKFVKTFSYDNEKYERKSEKGKIYAKNRRNFEKRLDKNFNKLEANSYATNLDIHNAFGLFDNNKAVCEGLSKGFVMICKKCGIEANQKHCITKKNNGLHAFCEVVIDGEIIPMDPTYEIGCYKKYGEIGYDPYITEEYKKIDDYERDKNIKIKIDKEVIKEAVNDEISILKETVNDEISRLKETVNEEIISFKKDVNESFQDLKKIVDFIYSQDKASQIQRMVNKGKNELLDMLKIKKQKNADSMYESEIYLSEEVRQGTKEETREK